MNSYMFLDWFHILFYYAIEKKSLHLYGSRVIFFNNSHKMYIILQIIWIQQHIDLKLKFGQGQNNSKGFNFSSCIFFSSNVFHQKQMYFISDLPNKITFLLDASRSVLPFHHLEQQLFLLHNFICTTITFKII